MTNSHAGDEDGGDHNDVMLEPAAAGTYTGTGQVMMAGKWNVTVRIKHGGKELGQKKVTLTAK